MMIENQVHAWKAKNPHIHNELQRLRPACRLALFIRASLWCIPAAAQSYAYVPTRKSNSVSVINTATNSVIAVVPVGIQPLQAAISPDGAFAYVTNSGWFYTNNDVSVISTATNTVVGTIPVGRFPVGVAFTPNGAFAYVANQNSNDVSMINAATRVVVATVSGVAALPEGVAIKP
jgi:YVTN family beta-propeller protein